LFVLVILLLIISILPLFFTKDFKQKYDFSFRKIFSRRRISEAIGYAGYGFSARGFGVIWPIILFTTILLEDIVSLGLITTLFFFFSFVSTIIMGKMFDKNNKAVIKIALFISAIIWIAKIFVFLPIFAYIADAFHGIVKPSHEVTVDAVTYERDNDGEMNYVIYRESMIHIGIIVSLSILFLLPFSYGFILFAAGAIMLTLLHKK